MPGLGRIGDSFIGTCCCHSDPTCIGTSGVIISGAAMTTVEGSPAARIGDMGITSCGHIAVIVGGSSTITVESSPVSRIGDSVSGCVTGVLVSGATTVSGN